MLTSKSIQEFSMTFVPIDVIGSFGWEKKTEMCGIVGQSGTNEKRNSIRKEMK